MRLSYTERWMGVGLIAAVVVWSFYVLAVRPTAERVQTLKRVIPEKQHVLEQLRATSAQYRTLQSKLDGYKRRASSEAGNFEPLRFLESTTNRLHLTKKVASMKQEVLQLDSGYCEVIIEIRLETVTLKELVDLLLRIKSSEHALWTKNLYARKNSANPDLLDASIQVSALKLNKAM